MIRNSARQAEGAPKNGTAAIPSIVALFVLWAVNFETFRKHYQGKSTFPWDFLGGYHAQAFGWYDLGSLASPPSWLPWTDMGFPAFLAIQSGGWYFPLALLHVLGVVYTVHAATMIQVLHVLLGAVGAFLLARRLGAGIMIALVVGLAYHFQAAFFSNQQHVDIVRAAAWFPWLLYTMHPRGLASGWWKPLLAAFVLAQLLISGYPGAIVAFVYASAVWVLMLVASQQREDRWQHVVSVAVSVFGGVLMAMPKWLPFLLNGTADIKFESFQVPSADPSSLFTLLLPYNVPPFHGDPTMRSLWLPLASIWGAAFASPRNSTFRIGVTLLMLGLVFCFLVPRAPGLVRWVPGMGLSRFPLADWRSVINVGLLLAAMAGWQEFFARDWTATQVGVRTTIALSLCLVVVIWAIRAGYDAPSLSLALGFSASIALISVVGHACRLRWPESRWPTTIPLLLMVLATALHGYWYQRAQPITWRPVWNKAVEIQSFGGRFKDFMKNRHPEVTTTRRPARMLVGKTVENALGWHNSSHYNQCWYMHTYCVFGYNNLRMSAPHATFLGAVAAPDGEALLRFATRPQQLLMLGDRQDDHVPALAPGEDEAAIGDAADVSVDFVEYGPGVATYRIVTPRALRVVENEIGWHGWQLSRCDDQARCTTPEAVAMTSQALRTWQVPAGNWTVNLRFVGPSNIPGFACFFAGLLLAAGVGAATWRRRPVRL